MRRRSALAGLVVAAASAAGALIVRQRTTQRVEKADLHFEDGTLVSLAAGSVDGDALLELGRAALGIARD